MGYELDKVMQQYGVGSASARPYVALPPREADGQPSASNQAAYDAARAQADAYRAEYMQRVQNTPMYAAQQFNTGVNDSAALKGMREKHPDIGQQALDNAIRTWFTANPAANAQQVRDYMNSIGANQYDLMRATGSAWGSPLRMPTLGVNYTQPVKTASSGSTTPGGTAPGNTQTNAVPGSWVDNDTGRSAGDGAARGGLIKGYARGGGVDYSLGTEAPAYGSMMPAAAPVFGAPTAAAEEPDRRTELLAMLQQLQPARSPELEAAQARLRDESAGFERLLRGAMTQPESPPDKAELYFRLAAAFGTPTKTGHFAESLGNVGQVMGEYTKSQRESAAARRQQQLGLALEAQKMRMQGAREDVAAEKAMQLERSKDAREALKSYIESGKPQSAAGKQAQDEGLRPGTPEFQRRVSQLYDLNVDRAMAQINATMAGVTAAMGNLAVSQQREARVAAEAKRLTPAEVKLKTEAEDNLASLDSALKDLTTAYKLNPNTFGGTLIERGQRKILEETKSDDPRVRNTALVENLLGQQGLAKLRATFGGNPTEGERAILLDLEGIGAKSVEQRAAIMKRAYSAVKARREREQKRLNEITSGLYRSTSPAPTEEGLD